MSDTSAVTPPDVSVWWDAGDVVAAALDILRLTESDVDANRVAVLVPVAGGMINQYLDGEEPPWAPVPAELEQAVVYATVELYRQKDSPPAAADDFTLTAGIQTADVLQSVKAMLRPHRRRFGVG